MTLVRDLMSRDVRTCFGTDSVFLAASKMAERNLGLLVVVEDSPKFVPVGVITDTDIIQKIVLQSRDPKQVLVREVMATAVVTIEASESATDAAQLMFHKRVKRLPVVENKNLVGIISHKDLLETFVDYKKRLLRLALEF